MSYPTTKTPVGYLKDALSRVSSRFSWIQGSAFKPDEDGASCYCLIGALGKARGLSDEEIQAAGNTDVLIDVPGIEFVKAELSEKLGKRVEDVTVNDLYSFNDSSTHEDVVGLIERAIDRARTGYLSPSY